MADYALCDLCGGKAFYDANIGDVNYAATWDGSGNPAIGIAVLCVDCNKTHQCTVIKRCADTREEANE